MKRLIWLCLVSGAVFGAPNRVLLSREALTEKADLVGLAQVDRIESRMKADGSGIVTEVHLALREWLKGEHLNTVVVLQPGGHVGDLTQVVGGAPRFAPGEQVLLFLEKRPAGFYRVVEWEQGAFHLSSTPNGEVLVTRTVQDIPPEVLPWAVVRAELLRYRAPQRPLFSRGQP